MSASTVPQVVEVFADVRCPFTHVGLRRIVARRDELGVDVALHVRAWPLELVNDAPLDGAYIAEEVEEIREQVAPDLFAGFDANRFPASSLPALGLAAAAYGVDLRTGERASLLLRDAFFERGVDIADPDELARIAAELGIGDPSPSQDAVLADWHEGQRRGVKGSPHFFLVDSDHFCPSLHIERVDGHLRITTDPEAFEAFIQRCTSG